MEPISRSSSSSTHLSDTALLEDSEKQPGFLNNRRAKRRLPWPILIPWVLCLMLLVGMFVQTSKLVDCSQEHFAPGEWGTLAGVRYMCRRMLIRIQRSRKERPL